MSSWFDFSIHKQEKDNIRSRKEMMVLFLLALTAMGTLHCRFEIYQGDFPGHFLLNGLNKLSNTFIVLDYVDLILLASIYIIVHNVWHKDKKLDRPSVVLSVVLSLLLMISISYKKYNSAILLLGNSYQILMFAFCVLGFSVVIYCTIRGVYLLFQRGTLSEREPSRNRLIGRHFLLIGFGVIFLSWLPWIALNYPGSGCPDSMLQLQEFFGVVSWGAGHPPLSTVIMGSLVFLGSHIIDANFGFFLYCFLQTCVGAWVFSLSMKKLYDLGISLKWCAMGILYFAFTPFWGTYAQWVEKDLLYTEVALLQGICMMGVLIKKQCDKKDFVCLTLSTLLAVFLRNNGIHAVLPALILLAVWMGKGVGRKRVAAVSLITLVVYEATMRGLYPALGIGGVSVGESLSIPLQQTARYVCEHSDEVTEYERQILEKVFDYEALFYYDPVISDPVKNHFKGVEVPEYLMIWFRMFFKHPGTYFAAFFNKSYGYLAPVQPNIEAWIQRQYFDYMEEIGLYHVFDVNLANVLAQTMNLGLILPLFKYLCAPGLYTWIVIVLAVMLFRQRRTGGLILLIPSFMNILVCLASPLAGTLRYELPTAAIVPLLIGWTFYQCKISMKKEEGKNTK